MPLRFDVRFASLLTYTPRDQSNDGLLARRLVQELKRDTVRKSGLTTARFVAARLREELTDRAIELALYFDGSWTAVPVPRSSLHQADALWPAQRISAALAEQRLVRQSQAILHRAIAVRKSATASGGDRPSAAAHYASLRLALDSKRAQQLESPIPSVLRSTLGERPRLLLVDDVITRGATMLAAASVLLDAIPDAEVVGFAVVRTKSDDPSLPLLTPTTGCVVLSETQTLRRP